MINLSLTLEESEILLKAIKSSEEDTLRSIFGLTGSVKQVVWNAYVSQRKISAYLEREINDFKDPKYEDTLNRAGIKSPDQLFRGD